MERAVLDDSCVWVILIKRKSRHDAFRRLVMESHDHAFIVRGCFTGSEDGVFCRPLRGREGWMCRAGPFERQPQRASQAPWRFPASLFSRPNFSGNDHQSLFRKEGDNGGPIVDCFNNSKPPLGVFASRCRDHTLSLIRGPNIQNLC